MTRILFISLLFVFYPDQWCIAGNPTEQINPELEKQAQQWLKNQPALFLENKGQLAYENGTPANNVLFEVSTPGMKTYITEKGISYVFIKIRGEGISV